MILVIISTLISGICDTTVPSYEPPPECMRVQVTNYVPYLLDEFGLPILVEGQLQFHQETNYQCEAPCNRTANFSLITTESIGVFAACITDWIGDIIYVAGQRLICNDQFGLESYRVPFYSTRWNEWIIPVDILTHEPYFYLTDDWVN